MFLVIAENMRLFLNKRVLPFNGHLTPPYYRDFFLESTYSEVQRFYVLCPSDMKNLPQKIATKKFQQKLLPKIFTQIVTIKI